MKQKSIDFRELLERLLPLHELPLADRTAVQRALRSGVTQQLEEAALLALRQLEASGAVRRMETLPNGGASVVRYQARDRLDVFALHMPGPVKRDGWIIYPRAALPPQVRTGIDQVRRLLRLDDPALLADPRHAQAKSTLAERLQHVGKELLAAGDVRLVSAEEMASDAVALDRGTSRELLAHPTRLWYCADLSLSPLQAARARAGGIRSLVLAGVADSEGRGLGYLEIGASSAGAFKPEDLALVALLADTCGGVLDRAARLEKLVFIDGLTSAYNRAYFDLQLQKEMARAQRENGSLALCIADIDGFKNFNTVYGYQAGNEVLTQVAAALRRGVRPFDTVARWGGEEFAVLLTAPVQPQDVLTVSERLRVLVERQAVTLEGLDRRQHRVSVTVSIGVALYPDHAANADDLWRAANQALLLAKRGPKNQVVFYEPQMSGGAAG